MNELAERLSHLLHGLQGQYPALTRVAFAHLDRDTMMLTTYAHRTFGDTPFEHYAQPLENIPSLEAVAADDTMRIIDDLHDLADSPSVHTQRLIEAGYRSSLTLPVREDGQLLGFVFFDATEPGYFTSQVARHLGVYGEVVGLFVSGQLRAVHTLRGVVQTALGFSRFRDQETGAHLDRMCRFARIIAGELAGEHGLSEERVEYIRRFATLHDVGKVAIPDDVLLKEGKLTEEERAIMRLHVEHGVALVDEMVANFGLHTLPHVEVLRNIVAYHHEAIDGSGYPEGLAGDAIPIEARITSVADVFDALTSRRPYKPAWSNEEAFGYLRDEAHRFDLKCTEALAAHVEEVERIQAEFPDMDVEAGEEPGAAPEG